MRKAIRNFYLFALIILTLTGAAARAQLIPMPRMLNCPNASLVQTAKASNTSGPVVQKALTETARNTLIVVAHVGASVSVAAPNEQFLVSDSAGNTYFPGPLYVDSGNQTALQIFYAPNIVGGANTVTLLASTPPTLSTKVGLYIAEYAGLAPSFTVDVSNGKAATISGTTANSATMTTAAACDMLFSAFANGSLASPPTTVLGPELMRVTDTSVGSSAIADTAGVTWATAGTGVSSTFQQSSSASHWVINQMALHSATTPKVNQPTQMLFTTAAQTLATTWSCSPMATIQLENAMGQPTNTSKGVAVSLATSSSGTFFADSSCQYPITSLLIGAGTSSANFYYMLGTTPTGTITASATGFTTISQTETVSGLAPYTWIGGGSCGSENWNSTPCWSGAAVPTSPSVAHFDANCTSNCNPILNTTASVGTFWVHQGFPGSISQLSGMSFSTTGAMRLEVGSFTAGSASLTVGGSLIINGAVFNQNNSSISVTGNLAVNGGAFTGGSPAVTVAGDLVVAGSGSFTAGSGTMTVNNVDLLNGGTVNGGSSMMIVNANWNNLGGTFNASSGTVKLQSGQSHALLGSTTFNNLMSIGVSTPYTITFPAGQTQTVTTSLQLSGTAGNLLTLVSSVAGTQWNIAAPTTTLGGYLNVSDSDATGGTLTPGTGSSLVTNDTNW